VGRRQYAQNLLIGELKRNNCHTVVELGCNSIRRRIPHAGIVGIDVVKKHGPDIVHDINDGLPFLDSGVDAVVGIDIIEHIDDLHKLLFECVRVLKSGGFIGWIIPRADIFGYKVQNIKRYGHKNMWSKTDFWEEINKFTVKYMSPLNFIKISNLPGDWFFYFFAKKA